MLIPDSGRAAHPKIRSSSLRMWTLDEISSGSHKSLDTTRDELTENKAGSSTTPVVIPGPTGKSLHFDVNQFDRLGSATDTASRDALVGDWTLTALIRLRQNPPGLGYIFGFSGENDSSLEAENYLARIGVNTSRFCTMHWEHGAGTAVDVTADNVLLPVDRWVVVTWRKSNTAGGEGPGGTCNLDFFINGVLAQGANHPDNPDANFTGLVNSSGGASGEWGLGAAFSGVGNAVLRYVGDIGGAYAYDTALTEGQIATDARRLHLLGFFTRSDAKVHVQDSSDTFVSLNNLHNLDWVNETQWTDANDNQVATARVTLLREQENMSLAHLKTNAKANLADVDDPESFETMGETNALLQVRRNIEMFASTVPLGIQATGADFQSVFKGVIDKVNWGGEKVVVDCSDLGARLVYTNIETIREYGGDPSPITIVDEMQKILDDNDNAVNGTNLLPAKYGSYDPITLFVPEDPGFDVLKWEARREKVLTHLRQLAGLIGWECRYQWNPDPENLGWKLTFFEPDRVRVDADVVIAPNDVLDIQTAAVDSTRVRNAVRITYPNSDVRQATAPADAFIDSLLPAGLTREENEWFNVDGDGNRINATLLIRNDSSIDQYGRIFMEIAEASSSQLDRAEEAVSMAVAILRDLAQPDFDQSVTMPLMWQLQVCDMVRFLPNDQMYTRSQTQAIKSITHTIGDRCTSTIQLRGKPALGPKRWLQLEVAPGGARPATISPLDALSDLTTTQLNTVVQNILNRTSYFTGGKFLQIKNPNFQRNLRGPLFPPDDWSMKAGTWDTDVSFTSTSRSGDKAIRINTTTGELRSGFIAVNGDYDTPYSFEIVWQWITGSTPTASSKRIELLVEWYDEDFNLISSTISDTPLTPTVNILAAYPPFQFPDVDNTAAKWYRSRVDGILPPEPAPGTAKYCRLVLRADTDGGHSLDSVIIVDEISLYRTAREDYTYLLNNHGTFGATVDDWFNVNLRKSVLTPVFNTRDIGNNHYTTSGGNMDITRQDGTTATVLTGNGDSGFYCHETGHYDVHAQLVVGANVPGVTPPDVDDVPPLGRLMYNALYDTFHRNTGSGTIIVQSQGGPWIQGGTLGIGTDYVSFVNLHARVYLREGDRITLEFFRADDASIDAPVAPIPSTQPDLTFWRVRMALVE